MTTPEPVAEAPVVPTPKRNRVGIAALVLALIDLGLPVLVFIGITIAALAEGAEGDTVGYAILGGFFYGFGSVALFAPIAIAALVLGIIAVVRKGYRKTQGVIAIILSVVPAASVVFIPAVIDSLF
jgi:hypothetical protein